MSRDYLAGRNPAHQSFSLMRSVQTEIREIQQLLKGQELMHLDAEQLLEKLAEISAEVHACVRRGEAKDAT